MEEQNNMTVVDLEDIRSETYEKSYEDNKIHDIYGKIIISCIALVLVLPIIVLDLYYCFNDNKCLDKKVSLKTTLRTYLLVSGFVNLFILACYITTRFYFDITTNKNIACRLYINFLVLSGTLFSLFWNVLGGVIFWSLIKEYNCDTNLINYLFISLILKTIYDLTCMATLKNYIIKKEN